MAGKAFFLISPLLCKKSLLLRLLFCQPSGLLGSFLLCDPSGLLGSSLLFFYPSCLLLTAALSLPLPLGKFLFIPLFLGLNGLGIVLLFCLPGCQNLLDLHLACDAHIFIPLGACFLLNILDVNTAGNLNAVGQRLRQRSTLDGFADGGFFFDLLLAPVRIFRFTSRLFHSRASRGSLLSGSPELIQTDLPCLSVNGTGSLRSSLLKSFLHLFLHGCLFRLLCGVFGLLLFKDFILCRSVSAGDMGRYAPHAVVLLLLKRSQGLIFHLQFHGLIDIFPFTEPEDQVITLLQALGSHTGLMVKFCQFIGPFLYILCLLEIFKSLDLLRQRGSAGLQYFIF